MAKSKARKKGRNHKAEARVDSTAGVAMPIGSPSEPPPSGEVLASDEGTDSIPPPHADAEDASANANANANANASANAHADANANGAHADESGEFASFFAKPEEEIHDEHALAEAALEEQLETEHDVAPRRPVHRRTRQFVIGFVGVFAAIGLAGAVMRKATPRAEAAAVVQASPQQQVAAPPPAAPPPVAAPPATQPTAAALPTSAPAVVSPPATVEPAAPPPAASVPAAAPIASAPAPAAAAAPADDDNLTAGQLLSQARAAIAGNAASKAATLAKKAIAKGAGGSAYYVLGAAYHTMGSVGAAKSAYGSCAKSGCPEAGECASLLEGM